MSRAFVRRYFLVLAVGAGLLAYELYPRDERRITSLLSDVCSKLNQTRDEASLNALRATLNAVLLPGVLVSSAELGEDLSHPEAVVLRARALLEPPPLTFSLTDVDVHVSGALARVTGNLIVTVSGSGEQHRDLRATEVGLKKVGSTWRIERVVVDAVRPDQPEARP